MVIQFSSQFLNEDKAMGFHVILNLKSCYYFMSGVLKLNDALIASFAGMMQCLMDVHIHGFRVITIVFVSMLDDAGRT